MGGILENVFAQLIASNGFSLRYYNKQKIGEVDFVIQKGSEILPIEIKSGKNYRLHAALNNVMNVAEWKLDKAIVFCQGNLEKEEEKITYLPWYMVMFLNQDDLDESLKVKLEVDF
jgi:predicted AAA+ superfamily ATPase